MDVFGIPSGETQYFGIQCKGKDEYANKQFTEQEVINEIEKAKNFKPPLKKLYFATTANKDAGIEEFVRLKNLENIESGIFEVHLFSWEDIADLIEENRQTFNYYMESQNFRNTTSVEVTFENGENEIILKPKFKQHKTVYRKDFTAGLEKGLMGLSAAMNANASWNRMFNAGMSARIVRATVNFSYAKFNLVITNTGSEALEDYKLSFWLQGDIQDIAKTNVKDDFPALIAVAHVVRPTTYVDAKTLSGELIPRNNILVGDDAFTSADIYIKPAATDSEVLLNWKLISKRYKTEGSLKIRISPEIKSTYKEITIDDVSEERVEAGEITDFIEIKD
ncbi:hypothetical protein [Pararcticibacter amylolyticus]|uniref:hypothetical protein n=1 Tax=Pararcticibacter amylolyticus TaxID=2173175 RepID=UPI00192E6855|nr:hypothetical protein [Pararcticibacter amylolyticus]